MRRKLLWLNRKSFKWRENFFVRMSHTGHCSNTLGGINFTIWNVNLLFLSLYTCINWNSTCTEPICIQVVKRKGWYVLESCFSFNSIQFNSIQFNSIQFNSVYFIYWVVHAYYSIRHIGLHPIWTMWRNYHDYTARASGMVFERTMPTFNTVNELANWRKIAQLHSRPVNCI